MIYLNEAKVDNIDQFRLNSKERVDKRSSKLYYTEMGNFPHGSLKLLDKYAVKRMLKNMNFKDFPDPNFYYIWSYEPEKIKLKTRDKEGKLETLSISLTSISDQENWKDKKFLIENRSEKDSIEDEIEDEVEDLYDSNMFKMSIFDKIEYMKNRGDINYEEYTVKSTIARNSKRFRSYDRGKAKTSYAASLAGSASRKFKRSEKIASFSRNLTKSFAGSVTNLDNVRGNSL